MVLALALAVPAVGSIIPPPASVLEVSALTQISQWAAYNTARRRAARAQMFAEQSAAFATCQATNPNPAECGQAPERPSQPSGASYFWQVVVAIKAGAVCRAQQPVAKTPLHSTGAASRACTASFVGRAGPICSPHALSAGRPARPGATRGFTTGCQGILVAAVSTPLGGYAAGTACGAVFAA